MCGPLRPPSTFPMDPTPFAFHHIPIHTRNLSHSPCWAAGLLFSLFSFLAKMAWNAIVCETTDVSGGNSIFPIFENTWFQAILAGKKPKKKRKERFIHRVGSDFMESAQILPSAMIWQYVCLPSCGSAMPSLECEEFVEMRRIPSMRGWYRDHIGKFRGQNQNSNPKASPNFQGHTSGFYFSEFTLGEAPGKKLANFYFSQPLKTLPLTTLSFFGRQMRKTPLSRQPSIHPTSAAALERHWG